MQDSLQTFFVSDQVEYMSKTADLMVTAIDLPKVLNIKLNRVRYSRKTNHASKSYSPISIEKVIYLERYKDSSLPFKEVALKQHSALTHKMKDLKQILKVISGLHRSIRHLILF